MSVLKDYLFLFLLTLLTHGLLFLHDGVHVDGWLFRAYILEGRWDLLFDFFHKQGLPQTAYLYRFIGLFPNFILAHRILAFGSLLAIAWSIYALCRQVGFLSRGEGLLIATVSLTYPAYQFAIELSHLWNLLPYALFLAGWLLILRAEVGNQRSGTWPYALMRIVGGLLLLISFMKGSLLVYHLGFWLLFALVIRWRQSLAWRQLTQWAARRQGILLLLPLLYWSISRSLFPPHGVFANYNEVQVALLFNPDGWQQFIENGLLGQFAWAYGLLPLGLMVAVTLVYLALNDRFQLESTPVFAAQVHPLWQLAAGLGLLAFGIVPFILVGKLPELHGFESRVSLLLGLPVAILFVAMLQLLFAVNRRQLHRAGAIFTLLTLLGFMVAQYDTYFSWQARWVKDQATLLHLAEFPEARSFSVLYVDDQFIPLRPNGREDRINREISRRFFQEMVPIFREAYGPERGQVGIDVVFLRPDRQYRQWVNQLRERTLAPGEDIFFLANYDPAGCEAIFTIQPTAVAGQMSKLGLARRYWQQRWLQPEQTASFLWDLLTLEVQALPCAGD